MQFEKKIYLVKENAGVLHIPIIRTGDLTHVSSVRCYTHTISGTMLEDFVERRNTNESCITFHVGEKVGNLSPAVYSKW